MIEPMTEDLKFRYLNLENRWPQFRLERLAIRPDGALTLAQVPQVGKTLLELPTQQTANVDPADGPAGIGVDAAGTLYVADPASHRIIRVDADNNWSEALPCLRGPGSEPGQLNTPRGVLAGPRDALYVADSGNHRVQVIDLRTGQVRAIWGQPHPWGEPTPSDAPGRFRQPCELAADRACHVYVLTPRTPHGGGFRLGRVQKFDADGRLIPAFWETMQNGGNQPLDPTHIAIICDADQERLFILDRARGKILVYDTDGVYDAVAAKPWEALSLGQPSGIACDGQALYVGDTAEQRVLVFDREGHRLGEVRGYQGPVAGLRLDHRGRLLIHPGSHGPVTQTMAERVPVMEGAFCAGPFQVGDAPTKWQRLSIRAETLPPAAHVQLYTYTEDEKPPPDPLLEWPGPAASWADAWRAAPADSLDFLVLNQPGRYLWIGGEIYGDGSVSPALNQMRLEYDCESWLRYLPGVYQRNDADHDGFLERTLRLFESLLTDEQRKIDALPRLFDLQAAPDGDGSDAWLDWLAGWLALELNEGWDEEHRRQVLAQTRVLYGQRGTVHGLERMIKLHTGLTAHITEPVYLVSEGDDDPSQYTDKGHSFCVHLYEGELDSPATKESVRQLVEREKPAHTHYRLSWIGPRMRVGLQARVGFDTIIADPAPKLRLDGPRRLGLDTVLAEERRIGGTIGREARVGDSTTLA